MRNDYVEIDWECENCNKKFTAYLEIKTGDIDTIFCSDECGEKYYENDKSTD